MSVENFPPMVVSSIARQIKQLAMSPPDGVTFVPAEASLSEIYLDMDGPEKTPYEGGVFRIKLTLTREYPSAPPKGHFLTKIFHPNVAASGDICVNTLKKDWTPETTLAHVAAVIRCLLIVPFPESSLNDDAGKLFMESYSEYFRKAKVMTSIHAMPASRAGSSSAAAPASAAAAASSSSAVTASSEASIDVGAAESSLEEDASSRSASGAPATTLTEMLSAPKSTNASTLGDVVAGEKKKLDTSTLADKTTDIKKKKTLKRL